MSDRDMQPTASSCKRAGVLSMVEVSRDGKRVYFTDSLYGVLDERFYPNGVGTWMTSSVSIHGWLDKGLSRYLGARGAVRW